MISIKKKDLFKLLIGLFFIILLVFVTFTVIKLMSQNKSIEMGYVELNVIDLQKVKSFYIDLIGLKEISAKGNYVELGYEDNVLVKLVSNSNNKFENGSEAGLYHMAIVFETQNGLAEAINRILTKSPQYYQGSADHSVTEAFYFVDPENNGVELYYDRPRDQWIYADGKPVMGSTYINEKEYINKYLNNSNSPSKMGHIHLRVGNIENAKAFYSDILLFDVITQSSNSLFISKDGYHHHLGINTWQSNGAEKRPENLTGLKSFQIKYYSLDLFKRVLENLRSKNIQVNQISEKSFSTLDPWNNLIYLDLY